MSFWLGRARGAQGVERGGPARIGRGALVERRERPRRAGRARPSSSRAARRRAAPSAQDERVAERLGVEADPASRPFEQVAAAVDLRLQLVLALARLLELLGGDLLALGVEVGAVDLARELRRRRRGGCRRARRRSMSSSMTFERLPSSRLIVSVLRTSTSRTRSSARWGRRSSGSGPRRPAGACGRCGRCAARCGPGSTAGRSGRGRRSGPGGSGPRGRRRWRCRMRSGSSAGSVLKRRWISLRASPLVRPVMTAIRSSARSVPAIACSRISRR